MKRKFQYYIVAIVLVVTVLSYIAVKSNSIKNDLSIEKSILLAGKYLESQMLPSGQFVYRVNMNPKVKVKKKYNILRHMGAIYSLNMLASYQAGSIDQKKIKKSLEYMIEKAFKPVEGNLLGVWSSQEISGQKYMRDQIKLGAVGLSLVAICPSYELIKDKLSLSEMKKLGDFILYMQKPNGGFYSKYYKSTGRDDSWTSLYYPGEAALGLVELYKLTKDQKYLDSAVSALIFLYNERKEADIKDIPADHWALIASGKVLKYSSLISEDSKNKILTHGSKVVKKILLGQVLEHKVKTAVGGFTSDGRTTPTATRVEGLTAFYKHLNDPRLKELTRTGIASAVEFLQGAQVTYGKYIGALPRSILDLKGNTKRIKSFNRRATEVRIDYVQHALSAFIESTKIDGSP